MHLTCAEDSGSLAHFLVEWYKQAIKVPNPNELPYRIHSYGCNAVSIEELKSMAEGVLIGSRVKPRAWTGYLGSCN